MDVDEHHDEYLPEDVLVAISSKYLSVRDVINLSRACHSFAVALSGNLPSIIFVIASRRTFPLWGSSCDNLFLKYRRGKCYDYDEYNKGTADHYVVSHLDGTEEEDIPFMLSEHERVISCLDVKMRDEEAGLLAIIVRPRDDSFRFLLFCPVVWPTNEYTPDYYGWEKKDLEVRRLLTEAMMDNLGEIKKHLEDAHGDFDDRREDHIAEDVDELVKRVTKNIAEGS